MSERADPPEIKKFFDNSELKNQTVRAIRERVGPFIYDEEWREDGWNCEWRQEYVLENGAIYRGEWNIDTEMRECRGS